MSEVPLYPGGVGGALFAGQTRAPRTFCRASGHELREMRGPRTFCRALDMFSCWMRGTRRWRRWSSQASTRKPLHGVGGFSTGSGRPANSAHAVRTGFWTGPPRGKRAPRVGISSTPSRTRTLCPCHTLHTRSAPWILFLLLLSHSSFYHTTGVPSL